MHLFLHIDFMEQQIPDATTLLKFRHLLEYNKLGEKIFADVNTYPEAAGLIMHGGTVVDADSGYVHTITSTSANVHDIVETSKLIMEDDEAVYGDSVYQRADKRPEFREDGHLSQI